MKNKLIGESSKPLLQYDFFATEPVLISTESPKKISPQLPKGKFSHLTDKGVEFLPFKELQQGKFANKLITQLLVELGWKQDSESVDMLGSSVDDQHFYKLDALIWVFDLNPDGSDVSFEWACENASSDAFCDYSSLDPEVMRSIIARNMRNELKECLKLLSSMISYEYAKNCCLELSGYVNLDGWNLH